MNLIVVIDDSPIQRLVANHAVPRRSGMVIPDTPDMIDAIDADDVGLLIVDRIMPAPWESATRRLIARVKATGHAVDIVDWTTNQEPNDLAARRPEATRHIQKTGSFREVVTFAYEWLTTHSPTPTVMA